MLMPEVEGQEGKGKDLSWQTWLLPSSSLTLQLHVFFHATAIKRSSFFAKVGLADIVLTRALYTTRWLTVYCPLLLALLSLASSSGCRIYLSCENNPKGKGVFFFLMEHVCMRVRGTHHLLLLMMGSRPMSTCLLPSSSFCESFPCQCLRSCIW